MRPRCRRMALHVEEILRRPGQAVQYAAVDPGLQGDLRGASLGKSTIAKHEAEGAELWIERSDSIEEQLGEHWRRQLARAQKAGERGEGQEAGRRGEHAPSVYFTCASEGARELSWVSWGASGGCISSFRREIVCTREVSAPSIADSLVSMACSRAFESRPCSSASSSSSRVLSLKCLLRNTSVTGMAPQASTPRNGPRTSEIAFATDGSIVGFYRLTFRFVKYASVVQ